MKTSGRIFAWESRITLVAFLYAFLFVPKAMAFAATDLNRDNVVDAGDAQAFLKSVAAGTPPNQSLDLDGDGKVGLVDALLFGRWINGLWEKPSAGMSTLYFQNPADTAAFNGYQIDLKAKKNWSLNDLKTNFPITTLPGPGYTMGQVQYEDLVGAAITKWTKGAGWNQSQFMSQVRSQGVVVSKSVQFPNYFQALDQIHSADLPLLFTTDALLHTVYLSYDNILVELEEKQFAPSLEKILSTANRYAKQVYGDGQQGQDVQEMLATALFLLNRSRYDVEKTEAITSHLFKIDAHLAIDIVLFGRDILVDFSQFKPRGHYTRSAALSAYFQAMMWLSRVDLAFDLRAKNIAKPDSSFTRMKKDALVLWDCLINSGVYSSWLQINQQIEYMVGMSDGLNAKGMGSVALALGIRNVPDFLKSFSEERFDSVMAAGRFGAQAILSQGKSYDGPTEDLDLSPVFSFMPQRFILDSYTFSQVVYPLTGELMPSSTHLAFALGDNSAVQDFPPSQGVPLQGVLGAQRTLYDGISAEGWQSNLYTSWLGFLRKLNGAENNTKVAPVFRTLAWRKKMRNTQLASWAQLRHNTILYAKQSYTGMITCSFPKAYVEPYPEFFKAVSAYALMGGKIFKNSQPKIAAYFSKLEEISGKLEESAKRTAQGLSPTDAQGTWLRSALQSKIVQVGCGGPAKVFDGWYLDLIYGGKDDLESSQDYTIADVHTHLFDDAAPDMVLHVGTGQINLATVAIQEDSCVTLYVGPVSSFYEVNRQNTLDRLTDEQWTKAVFEGDSMVTRPAWNDIFMGP